MKKKTINAVLKKKVNHWLSCIDDESLVTAIKRDVIITGGAIASLLQNDDVKDYDIYFKTRETTKRVSQYYVDKFNEKNKNHTNSLGHSAKAFVLDGRDVSAFKNGSKSLESFAPGFSNQPVLTRMIGSCPEDRIKIIVRSDGVAAEDAQEEVLNEPFEDVYDVLVNADEMPFTEREGEAYRPVFLSSNAITLSDKIQIVIRFFGNPEEIHGNYDFVHCTNYWTYNGGTILKQDALEALMQKELVYIGSKYPLCSVIRTRKFIKRGFQINAGQYLKMLFQISQLDLTDIDVLEEQLVGVDSAYFMSLISSLRKQMENDPNFKIENDYVVSIIDKIF